MYRILNYQDIATLMPVSLPCGQKVKFDHTQYYAVYVTNGALLSISTRTSYVVT